MPDTSKMLDQLKTRFGASVQTTSDSTPTAWVSAAAVRGVLRWLKHEVSRPYSMLFDLTGIDERDRQYRTGQPAADFTVVYHLMSLERNADIRIKVPLTGEFPSIGTIVDLWPSANWYERELWDMFGIKVSGHPCLRRILCPPWWEGHALRREHPARATEMEPFTLPDSRQDEYEREMQFRPEDWGLARSEGGDEFMFLNLGPHHPGTHGVLRLVLQLRDEQIVNVVPDIGFHHRGAEKMGERQSWHTYIPYTDRVDYLGGALNELPYLLTVERLAGIDVPPRAAMIRVLLCELYRISSHLVWFGTFALDVGHFSAVFYMFNDRERIMEFTQAFAGARLHPGCFRIGGVADDLPIGWASKLEDFIEYFPKRLRDYEKMIVNNRIFKARTKGVGRVTTAQAIEWGMTGPNLRATGLPYDLRKMRPYSGYEHLEFDIPTGASGDSFDRACVRIEEMRQSLRIIEQCVKHMPGGDYKSRHPLATPPLKQHTMQDIETLITHFLGVTYGPVIPPGEAMVPVEASKGINGYYLISDGQNWSYRTRIRTPSFPHIQMVPQMAQGLMIADLIVILGSLDYVLADVDR